MSSSSVTLAQLAHLARFTRFDTTEELIMTVREIPVDAARMELVAAAEPAAVPEWVELSDGSRRPSGNQAKDAETGRPLWVVDCLVLDQERAATIGVQVASVDAPRVTVLTPVRFEGLMVRVSRSRDGKVAQYWRASGVAESFKVAKPAAA